MKKIIPFLLIFALIFSFGARLIGCGRTLPNGAVSSQTPTQTSSVVSSKLVASSPILTSSAQVLSVLPESVPVSKPVSQASSIAPVVSSAVSSARPSVSSHAESSRLPVSPASSRTESKTSVPVSSAVSSISAASSTSSTLAPAVQTLPLNATGEYHIIGKCDEKDSLNRSFYGPLKLTVTLPQNGFLSLKLTAHHSSVMSETGSEYFIVRIYQGNSKIFETCYDTISSLDKYGKKDVMEINNVGLAAGTYTIDIRTLDSAYAEDNKLKITTMFTPNSSAETENNNYAQTSDFIAEGQKMHGALSRWEDTDYFRIRVSQDGFLRISLDHPYLEGDGTYHTWLRLNTADGTDITTFKVKYIDACGEFIQAPVRKGDYILSLSPLNGEYLLDERMTDGRYTISYRVDPASGCEFEYNGDYTKASELALNQTVTGSATCSRTGYDIDVYRFELTETTTVQLNLRYTGTYQAWAPWQVELYTPEAIRDLSLPLCQVSPSPNAEYNGEAITLEAGVYYIRMQSSDLFGYFPTMRDSRYFLTVRTL